MTTTSKSTQNGLVFYEKSHRYKLDGNWVPGVTTILSGAIPKPALTKWSAKSVAEYVSQNRAAIEHLYDIGERAMVNALKEVPWQQRDEAANRGTEVHDLAERYVNGESIEVPDEIVGHVESCAAFIEDWKIQPVLTEQVVGSREHQYAGKFDLVADSCNAPRSIFDWKTSRSGIYMEAAFQLVAYGMAEFYGEKGDETPMKDLGIQESYGVHIRADGYDVIPLQYGPEIHDEFVALIKARDIIKRATGDWRTPGTGYVGVAWQKDEVAA